MDGAGGEETTTREAAWCAADPHFTEGDPALPVFSAWLDAFAARGPETLVLLGDLFSAWTALPAALAPWQREPLERLGTLAEAGRRLVFVVGNRDYFVESLSPRPFAVVAERWDRVLPAGGRVRFEHGDLINTSDRNYRRWRRVSRSKTARRAVSLLPGPWQARLARRLERALAPTNRAYKAYSPQSELERWAREAVAQGCVAAAVGHFHEDREVEVEGLRVRFAPQFREDGAFLMLSEDGGFAVRRMAAPPAETPHGARP